MPKTSKKTLSKKTKPVTPKPVKNTRKRKGGFSFFGSKKKLTEREQLEKDIRKIESKIDSLKSSLINAKRREGIRRGGVGNDLDIERYKKEILRMENMKLYKENELNQLPPPRTPLNRQNAVENLDTL